MKAALYARVSTENQDLERQEQKLVQWAESQGYEYDLYSEKASSIKERPKFEEILTHIEDYDILAVTKLDRFARSIQDFLQRIDEIREKGCEFHTVDQPINTDDEMYGDLLLNMLALFADFERKMIRRRLEEGYAEAMKDGRVGRPSALSDNDKEKLAAMYESGRYSWNGLKEEFGVSKATISKALKEKGALNE